jgi:NAD-dependent SIR2 family protein deacetylase
VGVSQVESYGTADVGVAVEQYERTWPQKEELGLCEMNIIPPHIQTSNSTIANLAAMVAKAKRICCFSGAGISVESKIPAFWVDADAMKGTWSQYNPEEFHIRNIMASEDVRAGYWRMETGLWGTISAAQPNPAHLFFAQLHQHGKLRRVITQNIDRLHYRAGVPLSHITELHGNQWNVHCSNDKVLLHQFIHSHATCVAHLYVSTYG